MTDCENCERLRAYGYAQQRLISRLHRRAQSAESALNTYIKALQETGGVHESLYRSKAEGAWIDRLAAKEGCESE